ncbi:hypothetical protein BASA50_009632 [Batrachochytrium salamandrivorans]|uniref:30S ribosomal protein S17 n=1 Tax=Batrachochytrium salamandrivorans TaxID=1357716 RepID=A0ABQ8F399_9FUNG|nr:hypothetical protein BASA60_006522 [Batrachochytrium salamandrivorans]KAH6589929.1 hypothetical protein BASA50_009632 [Batrachochytrium salamandrivorans]KAH9253018.1 hypothetical protein BASA81_009023 [Batrachochytrium salamandrivorans]KAH9270291.1 hypothetical protein BASA83_007630 [Batrachochytrium salamandrivorans]
MATTGPIQSFLGHVIGTAMKKTIKVRVERVKIHPIVLKPVRRHKNYLVHDETSRCVVGDWVRINSCTKLSKRKSFELGEIVKPANRFVDDAGKLHTQSSKSR